MRALHNRRLIYILLPLVLLAVFFIGLTVAFTPAYAAESFLYLSADVTYDAELDAGDPVVNSGTPIPAALVYRGGEAYHLSFRLYESSDGIEWVECNRENVLNKLSLVGDETDPRGVGRYTVRVEANAPISGFKVRSGKVESAVRKGTSVGSATFTICHENLSVMHAVLDKRSDVILSGSLYASVLDQANITVTYGGASLADADYTPTLEKWSGGAFVSAAGIDAAGTYRLVLTFRDDLDLSLSSLTKESEHYVIRREFTVRRPAISLSLNHTSIYEKYMTTSVPSAVTLTDASVTALGAASYKTAVYRREGNTCVLVAEEVSNSYSGLAAGDYVYRVTFTAPDVTLGVSNGDFVDLDLEVKPVPYTVRFRVENSYLLENVVRASQDGAEYEALSLKPEFYDRAGVPITGLFKQEDTEKFEWSFERLYSEWSAVAAPAEPGRYRVTVKLKKNTETSIDHSVTIGDYKIDDDKVLEVAQFCVIDHGTIAKVVLPDSYYTGSALTPTPVFTSSVSGAAGYAAGKYTLTYYALDDELTETPVSPSAVGTYRYLLTFTSDVSELSILTGDTFVGEWSIVYPTLTASYDAGAISFSSGGTPVALTLDDDYTVTYYEYSGGTLAHAIAATEHPTDVGEYAVAITYTSAHATYNIAANDFAFFTFENAAASVEIRMDFTAIEKYDGGVNRPVLAFQADEGYLTGLEENVDYSVLYKRATAPGTYTPCGYPVTAGNYAVLVTFLRDIGEKATRGKYLEKTFTLQAETVTVRRTDTNEFVYNGAPQEVSVALTMKDRPYLGTYKVQYKTGEDPYDDVTFDEIGSYMARVVLNDTKGGSLVTENAESAFSIDPLNVKVCFEVPTSYGAMYSGSVIVPTVKYVLLNGEYKSDEKFTQAEISEVSGGELVLGAAVLYSDADSVEVPSPVETDRYTADVSLSNSNVHIEAITAADKDGAELENVTAKVDDKARLTYYILPRNVKAVFTYTSDLYYTGDPRGVVKVDFYACDDEGAWTDTPLADFEAGDYAIEYYSCDNKGTHDNVYHSAAEPTAKSYYFARLTVDPNGNEDDYITYGRYTIVGAYGSDKKPLDSRPVAAGVYIDDVFRIKDQIPVVMRVDLTNYYNEDATYYKVIDLAFVRDGYFRAPIAPTVTVTLGETPVSYDTLTDGSMKVKSSTPGTYTVTIALSRNTAYRIVSYDGVSYDSHNEYYIADEDVITYQYVYFPQRELKVGWQLPTSLYYDGQAKAAQPLFETKVNGYDSAVPFTLNTDYTLTYYKKGADGNYAVMSGVPTLPGDYCAEVRFVADRPDYKINVAAEDAEDPEYKVVRSVNFTLFGDDPEGSTSPKTFFRIERAVLAISEVSVEKKYFDGTNTLAFRTDDDGEPFYLFSIARDEEGRACGAIVDGDHVTFTGKLIGHYASIFPASSVKVDFDDSEEGFLTIDAEWADRYELRLPDLYAPIAKGIVTVAPKDVVREYDFSAVDNSIDYDVIVSAETFERLSLSADEILTGELYRRSGISVGEYEIMKDRIAFRTDVTLPAAYTGKSLADLFELRFTDAKYRIIKRSVTITVDDVEKVYGNNDPDVYAWKMDREDGFIVGDMLSLTFKRDEGENCGTYAIRVTKHEVVNGSGDDVSANYVLTIRPGTLTIVRKHVRIAPSDQTKVYKDGFDPTAFAILDVDDREINIKERFADASGDHITGRLEYEPTDDPTKFLITKGTVRILNKDGRNGESNYIVDFTEEAKYYTIMPTEVRVRISSDIILSKYYGEPDPVFAFDPLSDSEVALLGGATISPVSTIGRAHPETDSVGTYALNRTATFVVTHDGVDVSPYFTFIVTNYDSEKHVFEILPREIIVTVEDETFMNTGVDIVPRLKYMNANGTKLSASVLSLLRVHYAVPEIEYTKGVNNVTPVVVGDVSVDPNFAVDLRPGKITVVWLQDEVSATVLPVDDAVYTENKYLFTGLMLYKPVCFYKLNTGNGEQPSGDVDISLPIPADFKGSGYVAVAVYADGSSKAFSLAQVDRMLVYTDGAAYYVAIAEAQDWFYLILGVAAIILGVIVFIIVYFVVRAVKKKRAAAAAAAAERAQYAAPETEAPAPEETTVSPAPNAESDMIEIPASDDAAGETIDLPEEVAVTTETDETEPAPEETPVAETEASEPAEAPVKKKGGKKAKEKDEAKEAEKALREKEKAEKKEREKALREKEKLEKKEREKLEKEQKKLEVEAEKTRKEKALNAKSKRTPSSFVPTGKRSSLAESGGNGVEDFDVFLPSSVKAEQPTEEIDLFSADNTSADGEIEIPIGDSSSDDEIVISKSSVMFTDDEEEKKDDDDPDMI